MELRKHPKMIWRGIPSWPPSWNGPHGSANPLPHGEIGVLTGVKIASRDLKPPHCVPVVNYNDQDYFAGLFLDDEEFLQSIYIVLNAHIGESIADIGSLNIS